MYNLIKSYNLLGDLRIIDATSATIEDMCRFHSSLYIDFLKKISTDYTFATYEDKDFVVEKFAEESKDFGIGE